MTKSQRPKLMLISNNGLHVQSIIVISREGWKGLSENQKEALSFEQCVRFLETFPSFSEETKEVIFLIRRKIKVLELVLCAQRFGLF